MLRATYPMAFDEAEIRRENAKDLLGRVPFGRGVDAINALPDSIPGYLRLPLRLAESLSGFTSPPCAVRLGAASGYPATLASLPAIRSRLVNPGGRWPGADALVRELVTIPTHSRLSSAERDELVRMLGEYRGARG